MERFTIDFSGYIELDKNDMVINTIDNETGNFVPVDVTKLSSKDIKEGISVGAYYIDFNKCRDIALDGDEQFSVDYEVE